MKKVIVPSLAVLCLLLAPALVSAQMAPGLPFVGRFFTGKAGCGEDRASWITPPVFYVGYGFGGDNRGVTFNASPSVAATAQITLRDRRSEGVWLGLAQTAQLSHYLGVQTSGWILIPTGGGGDEEIYNAGVLTPTRTWSLSRQWGWLEGDLLVGSWKGFAAIAGFRWDYHSIRFKDPRTVAPAALNASEIADVTSSAYLPLLGGQYSQSTSGNIVLLRLVFWPWPFGNLRYSETLQGARLCSDADYGSGYFAEVLAEYSRRMGTMGDLGAFARFSAMHGEVQNVNLSYGGLGRPGYSLGFNRIAWTLGGTLTLNFSMPF